MDQYMKALILDNTSNYTEHRENSGADNFSIFLPVF